MKRIGIWGCGEAGHKVRRLIRREGMGTVVCFCDSDGKKLDSAKKPPVVSADSFVKMASEGKLDTVIFAVGNSHLFDVTRQLRHVKNINAYMIPESQYHKREYDNLRSTLVEIDVTKPRLYMNQILINRHCNLKCKGCSVYSNLVDEPEFEDFEQICVDLERIKELFWGVHRFKILGGEPLLNPRLPDYVRMARSLFPDAIIMVTTNALLLATDHNFDNLFWEMKNNHCFFDISLYEPMFSKI